MRLRHGIGALLRAARGTHAAPHGRRSASPLATGLALAATRLRHQPLAPRRPRPPRRDRRRGPPHAAVADPILPFRYYGPIEGRIVVIDRSQSDKPRLTLDRVVLRDVAPDRTPARVRVSLHGEQGWITPEPGLTVILTGHLSAPEGPVEPGGFDFRARPSSTASAPWATPARPCWR